VKQQYPVRHPPVPEAARRGETTSEHNESLVPEAVPKAAGEAGARPEPQLPHEHDESRHSQVSASPSHAECGKQAFADAASEREDSDLGPVLDTVYNDKVAPDRSSGEPRQ